MMTTLLQLFLLLAQTSINRGEWIVKNATVHMMNEPIMNEPIMNEPFMNEPFMNFNQFIAVSDTISYTFLLGYILAVVFLAHLLYEQAQALDRARARLEEEDLEEDLEEDAPYESQYFKQLEAMPDKALDKEELAVISQHVLIEETPKGKVYMLYNAGTETFDYYTDKCVDVTYEMLDTVARLFALTFHCKQICVNYKEEIQKGERNRLSEIEFDQLKKELAEKIINNTNTLNKERSVFATYKTYNKKTGNNVAKKYYIVTEKANRFKYKGKITEYEQRLKKKAEEESTYADSIKISYSEFKRLQQEQQEREEQNTLSTL